MAKNFAAVVGMLLVLATAYYVTFGRPRPPEITAACQAREDFAATCTFTNSGGSAGAACVTATLVGGGRSTESTRVCSGELAARATGAPLQALFVDRATYGAIIAGGNASLNVATSP